MKSERLHELRTLLEARRTALQREGDLEIAPTSEGQPLEKPDDDAQPLAEMNQVIASSRNRERTEQLRRIEEALARMQADPDGFGQCEACDEVIGAKRLELMPWVTLCIECQSAQEAGESPGGRRHITDYR